MLGQVPHGAQGIATFCGEHPVGHTLCTLSVMCVIMVACGVDGCGGLTRGAVGLEHLLKGAPGKFRTLDAGGHMGDVAKHGSFVELL